MVTSRRFLLTEPGVLTITPPARRHLSYPGANQPWHHPPYIKHHRSLGRKKREKKEAWKRIPEWTWETLLYTSLAPDLPDLSDLPDLHAQELGRLRACGRQLMQHPSAINEFDRWGMAYLESMSIVLLVEAKKALTCLTPSALWLISTTSFGCDCMILLTLGRVYGGQKISGQSLYFSNPCMSF